MTVGASIMQQHSYRSETKRSASFCAGLRRALCYVFDEEVTVALLTVTVQDHCRGTTCQAAQKKTYHQDLSYVMTCMILQASGCFLQAEASCWMVTTACSKRPNQEALQQAGHPGEA